jgi:hypothetical protein
MRSADELAVLSLLKAAEVKYTSETRRKERVELSPNALILSDEIRSVLTRGPEENIRLLVAQFVQFVESDEYFRFAERVDQATDTTKYTVWIASDSTNQKQAAVRLGRVRGDGWKSAQDFLGSNRPLAEGLSALQVIEMADRYAAEGLTLRVEPAFRWRLAGNAEH